MKVKILRDIFSNVGVLFASAKLLAAGTSDCVMNVGDTRLCHLHPTLITFDALAQAQASAKVLMPKS